jgi:hypothetical protein
MAEKGAADVATTSGTLELKGEQLVGLPPWPSWHWALSPHAKSKPAALSPSVKPLPAAMST